MLLSKTYTTFSHHSIHSPVSSRYACWDIQKRARRSNVQMRQCISLIGKNQVVGAHLTVILQRNIVSYSNAV